MAFTDWRTQAIESVAERERDALMARGALARARRTRCPAIVREWRRLARRTKRLDAVADERASVRARRLTFRAFRAFVASTLDALGARERELTRAMEVRMRAREVLAEAEMIAGRTSVEFEEPEAAAEAEAALAPVHIAALPAPPAHPSPGIADTQVTTAVIPPASQSPRHRVESIDESAIFDLSADDLDVVTNTWTTTCHHRPRNRPQLSPTPPLSRYLSTAGSTRWRTGLPTTPRWRLRRRRPPPGAEPRRRRRLLQPPRPRLRLRLGERQGERGGERFDRVGYVRQGVSRFGRGNEARCRSRREDHEGAGRGGCGAREKLARLRTRGAKP